MRKFLWLVVALLGVSNIGCFSLTDELIRDRQNGRAAQINRSLDGISL